MTKLAPGKGFHGVLNQGYLDFLSSVLEDIDYCYDDDTHDVAPVDIIKGLLKQNDEGRIVAGVEWIEEKDNFGHKVYREIEYKEGMLRVTVVLTKQGELRLDIREWYEPK